VYAEGGGRLERNPEKGKIPKRRPLPETLQKKTF
jgi:hypothetical protein